jgi:hypothetical protein
MRSFKGLLQLVALLGLAIAAFPIYHGNAQSSSSSICVQGPMGSVSSPVGCPANVEGVPGQSFSVAIQLSNVDWLNGFSLQLNWNQTILTETSVTAGSWAGGAAAFTIDNTTTLATGTLTFSQALLGTTVNVTSASLINVGFQFVAFGNLASNPLALSNVNLSGLINGVPPIDLLPAPTITNGNASTPPPASAHFTKAGVKPQFKTLNVTKSGTTQGLIATFSNTGTGSAFVRVDFTVVGPNGSRHFSTSVVTLAGGASGTASTSYTDSTLPAKYTVTSSLMVSGDGVLFTAQDTDVTAYKVQ